jgi:hypothetical protein
MKTWSILVAILVLALGTSLVMAEDAHKANTKGGVITKIDGANITIQPKGMGDAKPAEVTFATDDKTTVSGGDKKAVSDLKVGDKVKVVLTDDGKTAKSITVMTGDAPKKGGGDKK